LRLFKILGQRRLRQLEEQLRKHWRTEIYSLVAQDPESMAEVVQIEYKEHQGKEAKDMVNNNTVAVVKVLVDQQDISEKRTYFYLNLYE